MSGTENTELAKKYPPPTKKKKKKKKSFLCKLNPIPTKSITMSAISSGALREEHFYGGISKATITHKTTDSLR